VTETHVIFALRAKRAELSGELIQAERRIVQIRGDLTALDGALRVFDPAAVPAVIRPRIKRKPPTVFRHGEFSLIVRDVLRRAETPMSVREIAQQIATARGLDVPSSGAFHTLLIKTRATVWRSGKGLVGDKRPDLIAVGTPITGRPPHRTVRAAFPHTAPTLGV
jgi:hypothetical protein